MLKNHWFHILLALSEGELHGLAIMDKVLEHTDGSLTLWPATLYGSLKQMLESELIEEKPAPENLDDGDRRRFYAITGKGKDALAAELSRMKKYIEHASGSGLWSG